MLGERDYFPATRKRVGQGPLPPRLKSSAALLQPPTLATAAARRGNEARPRPPGRAGLPGAGPHPAAGPPFRPRARADPRRSALRSGPGGAPRHRPPQVGARRPGRDLLQSRAPPPLRARPFLSLPTPGGQRRRAEEGHFARAESGPERTWWPGASRLRSGPGRGAAPRRSLSGTSGGSPPDRGRPRGPTSCGGGRAVPGAGQG